ncbi:MAG: Holliday junction branch migration protein RuvA [Chitinophagales bacterium]|jgi:Holliday junction DNA helicase RuvA
MYAYLKGEITHLTPAFLTLEVNGIGFHLHIPLSTYTALQGKEKATLYTHFNVREDAHTLFGFATQVERSMFVHLISVSGVGPSTAQLLLSSMTADEIRAAIIGEQAHILQRAKGIGPKAAKQIILDLKDKMTREAPDGPVLLPGATANNTTREEALTALIALGFNRITVQKALNQIAKELPTTARVEEMIKAALKYMA